MAYRVGVIGCGRKGTSHARAYDLNPATEVVAAADTDPENLELFCERFGVPGYADYGEMLRRESIDIAAPDPAREREPRGSCWAVLRQASGRSCVRSRWRRSYRTRTGW